MARQFGSGLNKKSSDKTKVIIIAAGVALVACLGLGLVLLMPKKSDSGQVASVVIETDRSEPAVRMVDVLVPTQQIAQGILLEREMFRKEKKPQIGVSSRVVKDFEEIDGYFAMSMIVPGQPLHRDLISKTRPINEITANIPEGYRAVTISVDARSGVEGWVRPGAKVDVAWSSQIRGKAALTIIVNNAKVLSAERQTDPNAPEGAPLPTTVTLLITTDDAKKIQLAQTTGSLTLQLRGDPDTGKGTGGPKSITVDDLLGGPKAAGEEDCRNEVAIGNAKYCLINGVLKPKDLK